MRVSSHWQYLKYVVRHKWFVLIAGLQTGAPLWRLLIHDWSKFLPSEWIPYARYFYGMPKVGDQVTVDCIDGFWCRATVIEQRRDKNARYKVRASKGYIGEDQEFWAHDFEVAGLQEASEAFGVAWNAHQKRNPHHWQYWILTMDSGETIPQRMPAHFVREMLADWMGAGRAITGDGSLARTVEWYESNKGRMKLHPRTVADVESLLSQCKERELIAV